MESLSLEKESISSLGGSFAGATRLVYLNLARNHLSSLLVSATFFFVGAGDGTAAAHVFHVYSNDFNSFPCNKNGFNFFPCNKNGFNSFLFR